MTALWNFDELVSAAGGRADGASPSSVAGFSLDTRSLRPGEVFVALKDVRDGHDFVGKAFEAGAAAALVSQSYARGRDDGALIRVADPLKALEAVGRAARARLAPEARVIAVTGSAGKTGTKEMLRACLSRVGATHAAEKSFNNHWGVPLTLARMPQETRFGVFEIGMNNPGEITPLSRLVRPHVAIVTTVEPVHLGQFESVEAIADAKAEIFAGVEPGGVAILNIDNPHFARLSAAARAHGLRIVSFGTDGDADIRPDELRATWTGTDLVVSRNGRLFAYRLGAAGLHIARNSLAVVAALFEVLGSLPGSDSLLTEALAAFAEVQPSEGRGVRIPLKHEGGNILLIDESYNANPASMRAALSGLGSVPRETYGRRIAVLGDMLELGPASADLHAGLKEALDAAGVDAVFACGPNMKVLYEALPPAMRGAWTEASGALEPLLLAAVRGGDAIMVKGSLGSRMDPLVARLKDKFGMNRAAG